MTSNPVPAYWQGSRTSHDRLTLGNSGQGVTLQDGGVSYAVDPRDFGAVFDGNSHPLSASFSTLAAAQAVYPKATSLTNEIDGIAIQAAIDSCAARVVAGGEFSFGGTVVLPNGKGLLNTPLTISNATISLSAQGDGFYMRPNVSRFLASTPCELLWTGSNIATGNACLYMLTIDATSVNRTLSGCNLNGIMFNCNQVIGVGGVLIKSLRFSKINAAAKEARGVPYSATLALNSTNITVSSTTNIHIGEAVTSASLPRGAYVASIVNGTTIAASAQASANSSETLVIGGECFRFDVASGIGDSNDTQNNDIWLTCTQEQVPDSNSAGPCVFVGGGGTGSGAGLTHYGNSSINFFHSIYNNVLHGVGLAINNSDHNFFDFVTCNALGGDGISIVSNGTLDANNGAARDNIFGYVAGNCYFLGTDTGGFTTASAFNIIRFFDTTNGGVIAGLGAGATLSVNPVTAPTLAIPYNSTVPIVPYPADSTVVGGNPRGTAAVDLQTATRAAATQVASGLESVIAGGLNNTASGQQSAVGGGNGNIASASFSCVPGGGANNASQSNAIAVGTGTNADLLSLFALSSGKISAGRQSQYNMQVLRISSAANTSPVRLTADAAAASSVNTVNQPAASNVQANTLSIQLIAIDSTNNGANRYSWTQTGMLARTGGVGTTAYTGGTPSILTAGTTTGISITEAADTSTGGYSLTFTPPTGNTAIWRIVATVTWTRVDGA